MGLPTNLSPSHRSGAVPGPEHSEDIPPRTPTDTGLGFVFDENVPEPVIDQKPVVTSTETPPSRPFPCSTQRPRHRDLSSDEGYNISPGRVLSLQEEPILPGYESAGWASPAEQKKTHFSRRGRGLGGQRLPPPPRPTDLQAPGPLNFKRTTDTSSSPREWNVPFKIY